MDVDKMAKVAEGKAISGNADNRTRSCAENILQNILFIQFLEYRQRYSSLIYASP
jgi:hypothetical protein